MTARFYCYCGGQEISTAFQKFKVKLASNSESPQSQGLGVKGQDGVQEEFTPESGVLPCIPIQKEAA